MTYHIATDPDGHVTLFQTTTSRPEPQPICRQSKTDVVIWDGILRMAGVK